MLYDEFIKAISARGVESGLPPYFDIIDDDAMYPPAELAELIGVSPETIRSYCRQNKIKTVGIAHYKIPGIEAKRFLFKKIYKRIPTNIRNLID